jgi:hypothetical protein
VTLHTALVLLLTQCMRDQLQRQSSSSSKVMGVMVELLAEMAVFTA